MEIDFAFFAQRVALLAMASGFVGAALFFGALNAISLIGSGFTGYLAKRARMKQARARSAAFSQVAPRG